MSLNVVNLVGRVGGEPEIMHFKDSAAILCKLTLAVNRRTSKNDQPDWFNLEVWGRTAEIAKDYAKKGSLIGVQGSLRIETWTDKTTGEKRSRPVIRVDRLDLLGSKRDTDASAGQYYSGDTEF